MAVPAGLSDCARMLRRGDPDRYLCALFAPADRREGVFALYALNLELARAREAAREPMLGLMRLQWWRDALDAMIAGRSPPDHAVMRALAPVAKRLDRNLLAAMIEARARDFDETPFATLADLEAYVEATAAALIRLALGLLGAATPQAQEAAGHVGGAFGLAGLLRALPYHARARRLYLPVDRLTAEGVAPEAIFAGSSGPGLGRVVAEIAAVAQDRLAAARALRGQAPREAASALLPARLAAYDLARLRRLGFDPFAPALAASGFGRRLAVVAGGLSGRWW